jgi:uncharacterized membrane protein YciS (DUF1049 family)
MIMKLALIIVAMAVTAVAAYFLGSKKDKTAFQFLTEDNGNFSLMRLVIFLFDLAFLFCMIYVAIIEKKLINPSWSLTALICFINLLKPIHKFFESNPEKIGEIVQILRK